jgi:hypothetical protein
MREKAVVRHVKIAGQPFELRRSDVVRAVREVDPEPITSHYVVIGSRRFPPKQVIGEVTGLDRADFTSHQARRTLMGLGFSAGRRTHASSSQQPAPARPHEPLTDRLREFTGDWVAVKDDEILHAAESPKALVGWLARHGQKADSVFRVPENDLAASGLAPL